MQNIVESCWFTVTSLETLCFITITLLSKKNFSLELELPLSSFLHLAACVFRCINWRFVSGLFWTGLLRLVEFFSHIMYVHLVLKLFLETKMFFFYQNTFLVKTKKPRSLQTCMLFKWLPHHVGEHIMQAVNCINKKVFVGRKQWSEYAEMFLHITWFLDHLSSSKHWNTLAWLYAFFAQLGLHFALVLRLWARMSPLFWFGQPNVLLCVHTVSISTLVV